MFRTTSNFDKMLDKATSHLRLEPDWPTILQLCDQIRQGDAQPKYALAAIKKKLINPNPHVAMFALIVLESCVKNCGSIVHDEIGTKVYMEQLREFVKTTPHDNVKSKVLELIQAWAFAFRNSPKYRAVQDTMNIMKAEDYKFPVLKESDAMFSADTAPEWAEGDCCHRCRSQFSLVQRKHHCRACGQVFCSQCSSKSCTLPKFGIEKEVRVCDACYSNLNKPSATKQSSVEELPVEYVKSSLAQQNQAPPPRKSEDELREEEELQLAIALSQSEAEQKDKQKFGRSTTPTSRAKAYSPPPTSLETTASPALDEVDPELARYLNRSYWESRPTEESSPSAPSSAPSVIKQSVEMEQNGVASDSDMEDFVRDLKGQVEIFVNRMKSNSSRGRSIANDSSVQKLFNNITTMHSKLLNYIQQQDDSRVYYEGLQDKLVQVKDARAALDALRDEHREKLRREAEMAERQRQHQMAQKLDIMRKKKQEYLQYQRQLTLQKIQEQEREMQLRQEQQKQQYLMGTQYNSIGYMPSGGFDSLPPSNYGMPSGPVQQGYPHYPPQGVPGMIMPPQGYMPAPPGAPPGPGPIMRPGMGPMMSSMGPLPHQMMGQMPPNTSPAHIPSSQPGQGQIPGPQGQFPGHNMQNQAPNPNQVRGPQSQMANPHGQFPPSHQGPMPPLQNQIQNSQGQMNVNQGHIPGGQGQIPVQMSGSQGHLPISSSQTHLTNSSGLPPHNLPINQNQVPQQMPPQVVSQHQMVPGAPMSPLSNQPMQHPMMPPMGQPYNTQQAQPPPQEQTAELISFD